MPNSCFNRSVGNTKETFSFSVIDLSGHHYPGQQNQAWTMAKRMSPTHFDKLTREILCNYTDLTAWACSIFLDSCLQSSKENARGPFRYTGRKRAQMQSAAVERNWSLVIWNKYLNPWTTKFPLFSKHMQHLHQRYILLLFHLILTKNVTHTHIHMYVHMPSLMHFESMCLYG